MKQSKLPEPESRAESWKVIIIVAGIIVLIGVLGGGRRGALGPEPATSRASTDYGSAQSLTPNADAFAAGSGAYMDEREKQLYEADPSSRGYTDADREFLKEHGVSEDEARAAETVLHEHGIDD